MRTWCLIVVLVGCGKSGSGPAAEKDPDCALIESSPATAREALSQKYPGAPVKVAETIERCFAPTGETCDRMAKVWAAIPSMMPGAGSSATLQQPTERLVELCKGMPPEMQRCMLPSYVVAHGEECTKMLHDMQVAAIDVKPVGPGAGSGSAAPACDEVTIKLAVDALRYGRGADLSELAIKGKLDATALEGGLRQLAGVCVGDASLAAEPDVSYQDMILVMDIANKVGFINVGLDTGEPTPPRSPPDLGKPASGTDALKKAAVVVVTKTEVMLDGKTIAKVDDDVTEPVKAALAARKSDPAELKHLVILQADQATAALTINRVIIGANRAGYDNVLFAVKNK